MPFRSRSEKLQLEHESCDEAGPVVLAVHALWEQHGCYRSSQMRSEADGKT